MNANDGINIAPFIHQSRKRKASRTADDGEASEEPCKPATKKTKSNNKERGEKSIIASTDASDHASVDVFDEKTEDTKLPRERKATPSVVTASAKEDFPITGNEATANKDVRPATKKGIARRVREEKSPKANASDAEIDSSLSERNAAIGKLQGVIG